MAERPYILLSCGMSIDGYLDDASDERLLLSNDADFDRVDEVRAGCDAILVGASTIRQDNPRLLIRSPVRRAARIARGEDPDPVKVTVTSSCHLDPQALFFTTGEAAKLVYVATPAVREARARFAGAVFAGPGAAAQGLARSGSGSDVAGAVAVADGAARSDTFPTGASRSGPIGAGGAAPGGGGPGSLGSAGAGPGGGVFGSLGSDGAQPGGSVTIVDGGDPVDVHRVVADLGERGIRRLMVEGGGRMHTQFLTAGLADELQLVVAPLFVGDPKAPRFVHEGLFPWGAGNRAGLAEVRQIGDVVLLRYALSDRFDKQ